MLVGDYFTVEEISLKFWHIRRKARDQNEFPCSCRVAKEHCKWANFQERPLEKVKHDKQENEGSHPSDCQIAAAAGSGRNKSFTRRSISAKFSRFSFTTSEFSRAPAGCDTLSGSLPFKLNPTGCQRFLTASTQSRVCLSVTVFFLWAVGWSTEETVSCADHSLGCNEWKTWEYVRAVAPRSATSVTDVRTHTWAILATHGIDPITLHHIYFQVVSKGRRQKCGWPPGATCY